MDDKERVAWETMKALREVRDTHDPGFKEHDAADREYKKAELEYYKARK
jgi:hypothetical protein